MSAAFSNHRELGKIARDINRGVQFYRTFPVVEPCPGAKTQAEFDRRGVECKDIALEFKSVLFGGQA